MIVVTGGAGFIGSNVVAEFKDRKVVIVDWLGSGDKWRNLAKRTNVMDFLRPEDLFDSDWSKFEAVIHMGAISSTTETNVDELVKWNVDYSAKLWRMCTTLQIPFIYASSASVYGNSGQPLNPYAWSKLAFDRMVMESRNAPPKWAGLRFFNVYGPNEYHKSAQQSMVARLYNKEITSLFEGNPVRDFIYVKDCCMVIRTLIENDERQSGIYDVGTGTSRTFEDIAAILGVSVSHIPMPEKLYKSYQMHTCADMTWAENEFRFASLEEGISDYINEYLSKPDPYR